MCAKLIHVVLLLQMLAHGIFGCCWHHAHATEGVTCRHEVIANEKHDVHACNHHAHQNHDVLPVISDELSESSDPQPDRSEPCDEVRCLFVNAESTQFFSLQLLSLCGKCSSSDLFAAVRSPCVSIAGGPRQGRYGRLLTSARRCALLQAWLI